MNSPEERWWTVRAGEYVLGTLRGNDLILFERILAHDTTIQAEVEFWERRLDVLNETTPEQTPGKHIWPQVLERVRRLEDDTASSKEVQPLEQKQNASVAEFPAVGKHNSEANSRSERSVLWQTIAGLATAACLVLSVLLFQSSQVSLRQPINIDGLSVVLSDESGEPYFLVETDYENLQVRVTALSPPSLTNERDFQLWQALPDRSSVRPVALLPEQSGASRVFKVESLVEGSDLFGVSIEPVGAPTEAGPTGPVVAHGDFLPTQAVD